MRERKSTRALTLEWRGQRKRDRESWADFCSEPGA